MLFTIFRYCLITETWPQTDLIGWIQNTTFGSNRGVNNVPFPLLCMCYYPRNNTERPRAYYVPKGVYTLMNYYPDCRVEHTVLAFYILVLIAQVIVLLLVLYDCFLLISLRLTQKRGMLFLNY